MVPKTLVITVAVNLRILATVRQFTLIIFFYLTTDFTDYTNFFVKSMSRLLSRS